ncbi:hypothetical protein D3C75_1387710 [compost metagenome]
MTGGKTRPAILATALIKAIDAAPATPAIDSVVTAQKIGVIAQFNATVSTNMP